MKIDKNMCKVLAEIEYLIGTECYNPNSYDGWNDIEGCDFRYPILVPDDKGDFTKIKGQINKVYLITGNDVSPSTIKYMKYKFGSNELMIGQGIIKTLEFLEQRYGLDFNDLEQRQNNDLVF